MTTLDEGLLRAAPTGPADERKQMFSAEDNRLLTETGPDAPLGRLFRRYWFPALLSERLPEPGGDPSN